MFRRKKVPDWAPFGDYGDYERFIGLATEAFGGHHEDGVIRTPEGAFGLQNVAQICANAPQAEWPALVARHVSSVKQSTGLTPPESFEEARPLLRVRLVHPQFVASVDRPLAVHPWGEDILEALVCDFPESVAYVSEEDVERWRRPLADLLAIGIAAVRMHEAPPELAKAGTVYALTGDSIYTATHALFVAEHLPDESQHGTLIAVPNRHVVLAHPIVDNAVVGAANDMLNLARQLCEEGPGSISDQLYWHRPDQSLLRLPSEGTNFYPPDEFVQLLNDVVK